MTSADFRRQQRNVSLLLILTCCCLTYWNCLNCSFVFDDVSAVKENRDLRPSTPLSNVFLNDFWGTPMSKEQSHKSYRPICVLSFRANYLLHELDPLGYHLVNLLLHCVVCILYYRLCGCFAPTAGVALPAALLFAVHPVHTEAVTGVVGRAELLSSVFFLLALLCYRSGNLLSHAVCVAMAMFSKEQGITVLGVAFVYECFLVQRLDISKALMGSGGVRRGSWSWLRPFAWRTLVMTLTGIVLLLLRFYVMGSTLPVFTNFDNPASYEETPVRQLTWSYMVAVNSWLLLSPADLCCDWTMGTLRLVRSVSDPRNLFTLFTFAVLGHLGLVGLFGPSHKQRGIVVLGLSLLVLPFLPASNLFFPVGFVVAERVLYIPSMGFCLLVAYGFRKMQHHFKTGPRKAQLVLLSLLLLHGVKTFVRNSDWKNELSIFMSGLKVNSGNAKLFNNVGHALEAQERYSEALRYFQQATLVQPDDIGAHINVGRTFANLQQDKEAEEAYMRAKALLPQSKPGQKYVARIAPQHLSVFLNLANLVSKDISRLEEADLLYRQAISMRHDYIQAYINRGDVLIKLNRSSEALEVYSKALSIEPDNPDLHYNVGVVHIEQGKPQEAIAHFDRALQIDPDHVQALMNSAILIQETGSTRLRPVAYERLFRVMRRFPDHDRVYFNLGMLGMDDGDYTAAEKWFRKAIELKSDFRSALFNLALLLNEQKRPLEAIPFLDSLLSSFPGHIKGLVLLGDIFTNHVKNYDEAERCYQKILALDPGHIQARHNMCVVHVERGELAMAEECLKGVQELAPGLDYVDRHLSIVENRIKLLKNEADRNEAAAAENT